VSITRRVRRAFEELLGLNPSTVEHEKAALRAQESAHRAEKAQVRLVRKMRAVRRQRAERQAGAVADANGISVVTVDWPAHEVRLLASSEMERKWRARSCAKEPWTVAWLQDSLRGGGVFYDIGANVGAFSLIAARICGNRGTVVAFEPGYASFARLCDNIVLNRCHDLVIPLPLALGPTTGLGTLTYKTLHPGQSRHEFTDGTWTRISASASNRYHQPVLSMTLDEAVDRFRLPLPNHIKLDVDGGELKVLRGAEATLGTPELRSVMVEIDDTLSETVIGLLAGHGFSLYEKHKRIHRERTQVWYGVFRRRLQA
jgi:FkbM family methyltransferase